MKQFNNRAHRGFTLIELLIVIAVLGILATGILAVINTTSQIEKATLVKAKKFAASLENGLAISQVGKWSFEGNANDTSGYGNNGTLACKDVGCSLPTLQLVDQCNLGFGECLDVRLRGDYVSTPLRIEPSRYASLTMSAWIYPTTINTRTGSESFGAILAADDGGYDRGFGIRAPDLYEIQAGDSLFRPGVKMILGAWQHIVVVYQPSKITFYKNGTGYVYNQGGIFGPSDQPLLIGIDTACGICDFDGFIDEVQIYKEALTLSRIHQLYAQGVIKHMLGYK